MAGEHNTWGEFPLGQAEYDIPFDYLARRFVKLSFRLSTNPSLITELTVVDDFEFVTATRIRLLKVAEQGEDMLMIQRVTDTTRVVDFKDGSVLTGDNLNVSQVQSIHIAEEARDVITAELDATLKTVTDLLEEAKNAADSAKESIKHVDEISADFESKRSKMLRVGDRDISPFPDAAQRANRMVGFEQTGDAALIVPDPNSGISLGLALADKGNPGGAALVGHDGSTVGEILQGMRGLSMTRVTELGQGYANWPQGKMALAGTYYVAQAHLKASTMQDEAATEYLKSALDPAMIGYASLSRSSVLGGPLGIANLLGGVAGFDQAKMVRSSILPKDKQEREGKAVQFQAGKSDPVMGFVGNVLEQVPAFGYAANAAMTGYNAVGYLKSNKRADELDYMTGMYNTFRELVPNDPITQRILLSAFEENGIHTRK